jgi:trigger factor
MANAAIPDTNELTVTLEPLEAWARRLKITVAAARVERQQQEITRGLANRVRLPGFRKGKVPLQVVQKQFRQTIEQQALEKVIGDAYKEAVAREGLQPITQANVSNLDYRPGEDVSFDVEFEVTPTVELERLGGFKVRREKRAVGEPEVDRVLERLREEKAVWNTVEGENPQVGDLVSVDITPYGEDGTLQIGKARPYQIILGRSEAAPEVETAIASLLPGGEAEFTLEHMGEEGHDGHSHRAQVRLKDVKRPELAPLDDSFATVVSDLETLAELRAQIRTDLEREAEQDAETEVRRTLVEQILEANPFEVPRAMVAQYLERLLPAREGASEERLAEARQGMAPAAERAIKRSLLIDRVAELESLQAAPSDVDARLQELAARYGRPANEVRKQLQKNGQLHALEEEITEEKVFTYLKSLSTVE